MSIYRIGNSKCVGKSDFVEGIPEFIISEEILNVTRKVILLLSGPKLEDKGLYITKTLESYGIDYLGCSSNLLKILMDKFATKELLKYHGIPVTNGFKIKLNIKDIEDIKKINIEKFPVVIKPLNLFGGQGIYICNNYNDLYDLFKNGFLKNDIEYVFEEYIEGEEFSGNVFSHNYNIDNEGLGINGDRSVFIFPPVTKGKTKINGNKPVHSLEKFRSSVVSYEDNLLIRELSQKIALIPGIMGFFEVEFIKDENGIYKVIEINPRPSGTTMLSFEAAGYNFIDLYNGLCNSPNYSCNLFLKNIVGEYNIVHKNDDYSQTNVDKIDGISIIGRTCLRKHPPYIEKMLIKFDSIESYRNFLNLNNLC